MTLRAALLGATFLALPALAQAQPVSGLYIAGGAGLNYLMDSKSDLTGNQRAAAVAAGLSPTAKVEWENGFVGVLSLGYGFGNGFRAEIEGFYRQNDLDSSTVAGQTSRRNDGKLWQAGAMANIFYDFDPRLVGINSPVIPYIGGGVGWSHVSQDAVTADFRPVRSQVVRVDDSDDVFAYQGIAGVALALTPQLTVTAEYRFFGTTEPRFRGTQTQTITGAVTRSSGGLENYNHSALLGLRYAFNAPAPAPVAAPPAVAPQPPAAARTYLVFFDWDRADLTDRARQIIGEAAQNARRVGSTRIEVAGHADRSGTPQYNQRLSQRRAEAVAAELARQGISRNEMVIQAFGESRPLVPTADGVREPQNRRVEIVLR